tara:strand:- start:499 stop:1308 length:810 start_codon:yes stop_codon:yes gene_type:complete
MVENYRLMVASISPRPIAFVGTKNNVGQDNLAPFSFFNGFGANPPIVGFSPALSGRTGKPKDTLVNIRETKEFTVSVVNYSIANQMSLSSCEFLSDVDEFEKSGLTKEKSRLIKPYGVSESPVIFECKLIDIIEMGGKPGSGNLILGEILAFHVKDNIINESGIVDEKSMNLIGRMGYGNYTDVAKSMFTVTKPKHIGVGFDAIPNKIKESKYLNGNQLAKLAGVKEVPNDDNLNSDSDKKSLFMDCAKKLDSDDIISAWQVVFQITRK